MCTLRSHAPIDKLKKYNADQQWPCQTLPPPPDPVKIGDNDDDVEYVVDRILDDTVYHSTKGMSERHWLVGFEGYSDVHNEWLPERCINTYTDENGEVKGRNHLGFIVTSHFRLG